MRKIIFFILIINALALHGQTLENIPATVVIVHPDTALLDQLLSGEVALVEADYKRQHSASIQKRRALVDFSQKANFPSDKKREHELARLKKEVEQHEAQESNPTFRYFHLLSIYSTRALKQHFKNVRPVFRYTGQAGRRDSSAISFDSLQADYVVFFKAIHSEVEKDKPVLKVTTSVYSKRENKIIAAKQTEGDTISREGWECGPTTLSCLLANAARTAADVILNAIYTEEKGKR